MQSHFGVGPANSEGLSHFIVREAAKLAKNEHLPVALGKLSYLATDAITHVFAGKLLLRR